jgi:hypothetical protein
MSVNCSTFGCSLVSTGFDEACLVYSECNPCFLKNCSYSLEVQEDCLIWDCVTWTTTTPAPITTTTSAPGPPSSAKGAVTVLLVVIAVAVSIFLTVSTALASQAVRQTLRGGLAATATGLARCWSCCYRQGGAAAAAPPGFIDQFEGEDHSEHEPLVPDEPENQPVPELPVDHQQLDPRFEEEGMFNVIF